ncbi:VOC family protein [Paenibacillus sp. MER 99-2]|uniref:VOC family protein n=1 Tax=Paenibacillus sp. MER 99-2 TaxID=2939572 RepID=UPI00203D0BD6|nr:VOC family protein [Paenibacillus sp. MER 99-2]MCM3175077.1 VOC family protein [Paenibacillus sp. MER 99-2]
MINQVGQIMLYVNNQEQALQFWTEKAGFHLIAEENISPEMKWYEIAATPDAETSLVLQDKQVVAKMSPGVNLGTPSLMFFTPNIDKLYQDFKDKEITVGELVDLPFGRIFNFADDEDNYFAVMERK